MDKPFFSFRHRFLRHCKLVQKHYRPPSKQWNKVKKYDLDFDFS